MSSSISDNNDYRSICRLAAEEDAVFDIFRRTPAYNAILEHVTYDLGVAYLKYVEVNYPDLLPLLPKFAENDKIGSPYTHTFSQGVFSATTLRYVKVLGDLMHFFGDLSEFEIAEIGAGYGGQCSVISKRCQFQRYTQFDLEEATLLQKRYLHTSGVKNVRCMPMDPNFDEKFDLVISNYAFTECERKTQKMYLDRVIKKSSRGYMTCNFICPAFGVDSYSLAELVAEIPNCKIVNEIPLTHPDNTIIVWGD